MLGTVTPLLLVLNPVSLLPLVLDCGILEDSLNDIKKGCFEPSDVVRTRFPGESGHPTRSPGHILLKKRTSLLRHVFLGKTVILHGAISSFLEMQPRVVG